MRISEFLKEAELDPKGWGETPFGTDIDYFGLRVQMRPSTFLKLALPLGSAETNPEIEKHMRAGGKIAFPMLDVDIPDSWSEGDFRNPAKVVGHEGRNRMSTWIKLKGDDPIQVNIKPRGWYRRSHLTSEIIEALSKGLVGQRGNFVPNPFEANTALEEAGVKTPEGKQIVNKFKQAGYKMIGQGADATVWTKDATTVTKIIMPDNPADMTVATKAFHEFYNFVQQHSNLENLPKFREISTFKIGDKEFTQVVMEKLLPLKHGSFEEALVWQLSDLATKKISWQQAFKIMSQPETWKHFDPPPTVQQIIQYVKYMDQRTYLEYNVLFSLMTLLYHTGRINKAGWDLHTANVMRRKNGTLVIVDPWFVVNDGVN